MASFLYRLGHWCVQRRRIVLGFWLALLLGLAIWSNAANGVTNDKLTIPGTESQEAADLLAERFPTQSGSTVRVALEAPPGQKLTDTDIVDPLIQGLIPILSLPGVAPDQAPTPTVTPDERIAFFEVRFTAEAAEVDKEEVVALIETVERAVPPVVTVAFGGDAVDRAVEVEEPPSEAIGLLVAVFVLVVAFGSVVAMGLPMLTALIGVGVGILGIGLASAFVDLSSTAPTLAVMIGLAVGIDYSLFVVTRHRAFLHSGLSIEESAARANATSGGAVVFAGLTVVVALAGLSIVGIPFLTAMGLAAAATVLIAVLIAITLTPSMLGFAGANIDKLAIPGIKVTTGDDDDASTTFSGRFAKAITKRPWVSLGVGLAAIVVLAIPMLSMRLGLPDDGTKPEKATQRQAYDILADGFGAGFNGPLTLVVDLEGLDETAATEALDTVSKEVADTDDVVIVAPAAQNDEGDTAIILAIPGSGPSTSETEDLIHQLRSDVLPPVEQANGVQVAVTGTTAANIDISEKLADALPTFMAFVIILSMILLLVAFRSVVVPIKAAIAILLSIGASLGILVAVFQWGWGASLIGVDQTEPLISFLPLLMFGILFGLSMDYEVFILSRIKEDYSRTGKAQESVISGLTASARVITAAAIIMISVFAAFVLGDETTIKMFGIGFASAVLIDATIVRMIIVPAVMTIFGDGAWWLPRWLRWIPNLDVEGEKLLEELEHADAAEGSDGSDGSVAST